MIAHIMVTCSIGACQPIVGDAINRVKEIKEETKVVDYKQLKLYTSDGYGYTIKLNNERKGK